MDSAAESRKKLAVVYIMPYDVKRKGHEGLLRRYLFNSELHKLWEHEAVGSKRQPRTIKLIIYSSL